VVIDRKNLEKIPSDSSQNGGKSPLSGLSTGHLPLKRGDWQPGLMLMGEMTAWIVGPIILALFVGKWLDQKYSSEPWFFLGLVGLAFIITAWKIVQIGKDYIKKIEQEVQQKQSKKINSNGDDRK